MRLYENIGKSGDLVLLNSDEINNCLKILARYNRSCFILDYLYQSEYFDMSYADYIKTIKTIDRVYTDEERERYSAIIAASAHYDHGLREFLINELENIYRRKN